MEKKLPEFKPLPELGNVSSNYMSAFNVGMNIYEALAYLQGYVQAAYNSQKEVVDDWNNLETWIQENLITSANEKTQEILQGWLDDGTLAETIKQSAVWAEKVDVAGDTMTGDLQFQENKGVYGTLHSGDKVNMISHTYTGSDDYTQIGDSESQAVVRSKDRPVWYDGSQNQDLLVEEDLPPKENLLDNSNFKRGIINQKGQNVYTNLNGYAIDRWKMVGTSSVSLTVNTDSVTIDSNTSLIQYLDLEDGQKYHFVAYFNDNLYSLDFVADFDSNVGTENKYMTSYYDSEKQKYVVGIRNGVQKTIEYMKLEKGSIFTGMPQWDFTEELVKCSRFQKVFALNSITYAPISNFESQQTFLFEINFYKTPTVIVLNEGNKSNVTNDIFVFTANRMVWDIIATAVGIVSITDKIVVLDANI